MRAARCASHGRRPHVSRRARPLSSARPRAGARYNDASLPPPPPAHERTRRPLRSSSAVELAPRDPILGVTEAFNADPNPRKVNLGVGVYCDENGKVPLLECVKRAEREMTDSAAPRSLPAHRRHSRLRPRGAGAALRRRQPTSIDGRPRGHRAGAGRHRRAQGRRRFPAPLRARRAGVDQRSQLGEPPRAVRRRRASRSTPTPTTTRPRAASTSPA